ncbi:hypothetical protein LTR17_019065 [Elasticomyces elasticus]|nr:hypothetical protein LTR17_019065 [Elasticomyces elasticus]
MSAQNDSLRDSRIHFRQTHHEFQQLGSGSNGTACLAAKKNANDQQAQIPGVRALAPSRQVDPERLIVVKYRKQNDDPEESDESNDLSNEIAIMKTFGSLLFMYFGITSVDASGNAIAEPRWSPITHNDMHNNNIYLGLAPAAAEYKHSNFPLVLLADFGQSKSHPDYGVDFLDAAKIDIVTLSRHVIRRFYDATTGAQCFVLEEWMDKCEDILERDEEFNVSTMEFLLDLHTIATTERRKGDQNMPQAVLNEIASVPRLIDTPVIEEE